MLLRKSAVPMLGRRVRAIHAIFLGVLAYFFYLHYGIPSLRIGLLPAGGKRQPELANRIDALRTALAANYTTDHWVHARQYNDPNLGRLSDCLRSGDCGSAEDKIVILASTHFSNIFTGATSGEAVWADSTHVALTSLNYTLTYAFTVDEALMIHQHVPELVRVIIWPQHLIQECVKAELAEEPELDEWRKGEKGCIKTPTFPQGIPMWKSFVWHFWVGPQTVLGPQWTLSPEDYGKTNGQYLGYSIEHKCEKIPFKKRRLHQGVVLGKEDRYFKEDDNAFFGLLHPIAANIPKDSNGKNFHLFANVRTAAVGPDHLPEPGLYNKGSVSQAEYVEEVSRSKFMLGIGKPSTSPSPYDALCMGTPFINPITNWDWHDPENRTRWTTQHGRLNDIPEPYSYIVRKGDKEALERAIRLAIANPIDRYYIPSMRLNAVKERHRHLVETDWYEEAVKWAKGEKMIERGVELLL